MLPIKLAKNPPKVEPFPTYMHMNVIKRFINIIAFESTPKITLIWGLKNLNMYQLIINPNTTILI